MTKLPITNIFKTDLKTAKDIGLFGPMSSPSRDVLQARMKEYNDSLLPEPIEVETIIYSARDIEHARQSLVKQSVEPIEPIEPSALERAMALLQVQNPDLSSALLAEFNAQRKKPSAAKKEPVDKTEKIRALVEKYRIAYQSVTDLIKNDGKTKSKACLRVADRTDTSPGRVAFMYTAYKVYAKYPEVAYAIDNGKYSLASLQLDATKADRSQIISEKLGIALNVTLD